MPVTISLCRLLGTRPGNVFFSPYGVSLTLAMAEVGARGATREEIEAVLGHTERGEERLAALADRVRKLRSASTFQLFVANALWAQSGVSIRPDFVESLRDRVRAEVREADFERNPRDAARRVNRWVADATRNKISNILDHGQVDALTRVLLSSAVYFKAPWFEPFRKAATRPGPFHLQAGQQVQVPLMCRVGDYLYARDRHLQALQMPYRHYPIKATVLLPDEGHLGAVDAELSDARLAELMSAMTATKVRLTLPRFRIDCLLSLRSRLQELGVVTAFSSGADLSGISKEEGLFLRDVLQRTFVDVNEWGTEAAAATLAVLFKGGLGARGGLIDFRVDRPFLFLISDTETGTVLFLGRVVDPRG